MLPKTNDEDKKNIKYVSPQQDPYAMFHGKYVEIRLHGNVASGVYRGITQQGYLVLQPHIEARYLHPRIEKMTGLNATLHWNDEPQLLTHSAVLVFSPRTQEFFDHLIKQRQLPEPPAREVYIR